MEVRLGPVEPGTVAASITSALMVMGKRDTRNLKTTNVDKMIGSRFSNRHCLKITKWNSN